MKAGSIIPFSADMEYADERNGEVSHIRVYEGADGAFELYHDAGDGYEYEKGQYSLISIAYKDEAKELLFEKKHEKYKMQDAVDIQFIKSDGTADHTIRIL